MRGLFTCFVASLPLLAGGCLSLHSNQPLQQAYVLSLPPATGSVSTGSAVGAPASAPATPGAPAATAPAPEARAASAASVQVLQPVAAAGLDGEGIAVLRPGQRLDYYSGARWAESAPAMVQALLIEALRRQRSFQLVESGNGPFAARYVLSVELTHFEADYGGSGADGSGGSGAAFGAGSGNGAPTAHVALVCTLGRRSDGGAVTTLTVNSTVTAEDNRMQAVVDAFERATDRALMRIAQQLTPPATP